MATVAKEPRMSIRLEDVVICHISKDPINFCDTLMKCNGITCVRVSDHEAISYLRSRRVCGEECIVYLFRCSRVLPGFERQMFTKFITTTLHCYVALFSLCHLSYSSIAPASPLKRTCSLDLFEREDDFEMANDLFRRHFSVVVSIV